MENKTRRNLDQLLAESEQLEAKYNSFGSDPDDAFARLFMPEITEWLQSVAAHGQYIPPGSVERRALRSMLEGWAVLLRDRRAYAPGIEVLPFDPLAGFGLTVECPYPGLNAYEQKDHDAFFGRRLVAESYAEHLDGQGNKILLIVGASGSGKSSLALAGILPILKQRHAETWCFAPDFTPDAHPLQKLAAAIAVAIGQRTKEDEILQVLNSDPAEAWQRLATLCQDRPLMLVVDQFEELLTTTPDEEERKTFGEILTAITDPATSGTGFSCHVLLTLRTDHLARFETSDGLKNLCARLIGENQRQLSPIGFEDIKLAIKGPADAVGLRFIPATLIDRLASQTAGLANGLPLLQYALLRLWDTRPRNAAGEPLDLINEDMVNALPDVEHALGSVADNIFRKFSDQQQLICERLLLELVVLDESFDEPLRRRRKEEEIVTLLARRLGESGDVIAVIDAFLDAGLLRRFGKPPDSWLEVSHEALLRRWTHIHELLTGADVKERLHLVKQIGRWATTWERHGRSKDYLLLRGAPLEKALRFAREGWLAEVGAAAYVEACRQDEESQNRKDEQVRQEKERARQEHENRLKQEALLANERRERAEEAVTHARDRERWQSRLAWGAGGAAVIGVVLLAFLLFQTDGRQHDAALSTMRFAEEQQDPHAALAFMAAALRRDPGTWNLADKLLSTLARRAQLSSQILPHNAAVHSVAFSPDDKYVVTACADGVARVWDAEDGTEVPTKRLEHLEAVTHVEFSRDGRHLVTASLDGTARVWEWPEPQAAKPWEIGSVGGPPINGAKFSPDGALIVTAYGGSARVWDMQTRQEVGALRTGGAYDADFSPDGKLVVVRSQNGPAIVFEARNALTTQQTLGAPNARQVNTVRFSHSGEFIVIGARDRRLGIWKLEDGRYKEISDSQTLDQDIISADFSSDSKWLLTADATGAVAVRAAPDFQVVTRVQTNVGESIPTVVDVKFYQPTAPGLAPTFAIRSREGTAQVFRITSVQLPVFTTPLNEGIPPNSSQMSTQVASITVPLFHRDAILAFSFSRNGSTIATASLDGTARLWNLERRQERETLRARQPDEEAPKLSKAARAVDLTVDDTKLAVGSDDGLIVLEHREGGWVQSVRLSQERTSAVKFSGNGQSVIAVQGGQGQTSVVIFDLTTRAMEVVPPPPAEPGFDPNAAVVAALSPDAGRWAVGFMGGAVHVGARGQQGSFKCGGHKSIVSALEFSPDGQRLLSASYDETAAIMNLERNGSCSRRSRISNTSPVNNATFNPDGNWVVTASPTGARVWSAETGRLVVVLDPSNSVRDAAFDDGGNLIVTAAENEARIWDARTGAQLRPGISPLVPRQHISWAKFRRGAQYVVTADLVEKDFGGANGPPIDRDLQIRLYPITMTVGGATIGGFPLLARLGWKFWPNHQWRELSDLLEATAGLRLEERTQRLLPVENLAAERARYRTTAPQPDSSSTIDGIAQTLLPPRRPAMSKPQ